MDGSRPARPGELHLDEQLMPRHPLILDGLSHLAHARMREGGRERSACTFYPVFKELPTFGQPAPAARARPRSLVDGSSSGEPSNITRRDRCLSIPHDQMPPTNSRG